MFNPLSSSGPGPRSGPGQVPGQVQVRSRRSGPEGPRTKDERAGPGLTLNLACHHHHSPPPPPLNFSPLVNDSKPLLNDL